MITITGGKLTTFRRMAKLAVDRLVERDGRDAPCRTQEIPLGMAVDASELPRVEGVPEDAYAQLAGRYGYAAREVLDVAGERGELAQPVVPAGPTCSPRSPTGRGASRRARWGTRCCGARGSGCWPRASSLDRTGRRRGAWRRRWRAELGWDDARAGRGQAFLAEAGAEGIVTTP